MTDADEQRADILDGWEHAASGWGRRAQRVRDWGMPVSTWMIEQLSLQPGMRLLELAAGPGDTGFLAAELIAPGGTLISSDASEGMLDVARERARDLGVSNVSFEFKQLEIEWIDLPTASVDAILCRWAYMLTVDPAAGLSEARRVLAPGGRFALAVWDRDEENPWSTIPTEAIVQGGYMDAPDRAVSPGIFSLADPERLQDMLEEAGFVDVLVESIDVMRDYDGFDDFWGESLDLSPSLGAALERLTDAQRDEIQRRAQSLAEPFSDGEEGLHLPGVSLVASATA
ncbi:MAG TPA: methyltransferase domain-containing protein [Solirubrobacteraceae bacterium]|nr:methyltransferase domain-containing protein [Solirubrobacteraceae bacterium]